MKCYATGVKMNRITTTIFKSMCLISLWMLVGGTAPLPEHALYLSVSELEIVSDGPSTIRIKVFSDDLQNALINFSQQYQPAGLQTFFEKNTLLAQEYFEEHLQLKVDGEPVSYNYTGHTIEGDAHFITYQFHEEKEITRISMEADFFMELFPTQTNIIKVKRQNEQLHFKFTHPTTPQAFTWTR